MRVKGGASVLGCSFGAFMVEEGGCLVGLGGGDSFES